MYREGRSAPRSSIPSHFRTGILRRSVGQAVSAAPGRRPDLMGAAASGEFICAAELPISMIDERPFLLRVFQGSAVGLDQLDGGGCFGPAHPITVAVTVSSEILLSCRLGLWFFMAPDRRSPGNGPSRPP